jgi:lipopolysaccharide transport system permease protein
MKNNLLLSLEFVKREIKERYISTSLGNLWLFIHPIVMLIIYTVIFSDFMKMKLNLVNSKYAYSIYLIPGLLSWNFFAITVDRLSNSFFEKAHLIKKVNIPMIVFYFSIALSEFIILIISMILGLIFLFLVSHYISLKAIIVLFVYLFLLFIFTFSLGIIFSLFVPFFRDLKQIIPIILQLWFWMTPIIYPKSLIYNKYPLLVDFNPIYYFIYPMQNIFLYSKLPSFSEFLITFLISSITFFVAIFLYKKISKEIKDII